MTAYEVAPSILGRYVVFRVEGRATWLLAFVDTVEEGERVALLDAAKAHANGRGS